MEDYAAYLYDPARHNNFINAFYLMNNEEQHIGREMVKKALITTIDRYTEYYIQFDRNNRIAETLEAAIRQYGPHFTHEARQAKLRELQNLLISLETTQKLRDQHEKLKDALLKLENRLGPPIKTHKKKRRGKRDEDELAELEDHVPMLRAKPAPKGCPLCNRRAQEAVAQEVLSQFDHYHHPHHH
jgi:hypothetical protein